MEGISELQKVEDMTSPTEYIESRKTALYQYIGTYGMMANKLDTDTTSYRSLLRLFKGEKIRMRTVDSLYQMARKITGITIPVKGEQYDEWFENVINEIERYRTSEGLSKTNIEGITGIHRNNYNVIRKRIRGMKGDTLYECYMNLKRYQQL